jgi:hypothetical protein
MARFGGIDPEMMLEGGVQGRPDALAAARSRERRRLGLVARAAESIAEHECEIRLALGMPGARAERV